MPKKEPKQQVNSIPILTIPEAQDFTNLPISTQTVMAYMNCSFKNIDKLFEMLDINNSFDTLLEAGEYGKQHAKKEHGRIYQAKYAGQVKGIPSKRGGLRNQITATIFVLDKLITVKIIPTGKFHLTGCKTLEHSQKAAIELIKIIRIIDKKCDNTIIEMEDDQPLNCRFQPVMINVHFHLGFDVDQNKLDMLLQNDTIDFTSIYETQVNTGVNVKMTFPEPKKVLYDQIIIKGTLKTPKYIFTTTTECPKAKPAEVRNHTFLVFSTSIVIQSGTHYTQHMGVAYQKFRKFILDNRDKIELRLDTVNTFDITKINGFKYKKQIVPFTS